MTEYQGPNVYRVLTTSAVAEIRFTFEELRTLQDALSLWAGGSPVKDEVAEDCRDRVHRALTAMRTQYLDRPTESRAYHAKGGLTVRFQ